MREKVHFPLGKQWTLFQSSNVVAIINFPLIENTEYYSVKEYSSVYKYASSHSKITPMTGQRIQNGVCSNY